MSRGAKIAGAIAVVVIFLIAVVVITLPQEPPAVIGQEDRLAAIPSGAVKMGPENDEYRPVVHSPLWLQPVPMPGPVNTAGAEDSPFITHNGTWFFFFFTPDVDVPANEQLLDGVTGIWWTRMVDGDWSSPEKIVLHNDLSLEGAQCCVGTKLWFASVREGNYGEIDVYTADYVDGRWINVKNAGEQLNVDYDIGEFHVMPNGTMIYFHSGSWDAGESMDIFTTVKVDGSWSTPVPVSEINTDANEGFPYVTPDGSELWFTSPSKLGYAGPAIFKSEKLPDGSWGEPEEIISNFAAEPSLDHEGNIYFAHHYIVDGVMVEADIYVAYRV